VINHINSVGITQESANARLRRFGIIVTTNKIIVSNSSSEILNVIKDSSWSKNYNKILDRMPGSEKVESRSFTPGLKSRGISLPIELIFDDN
jgi:septum formation inhibitor-activating ATPase MinD